MIYIGVDISKNFFDCAFKLNDNYEHRQFPNTKKGFKQAIKWAKHQPAHWVMEATGRYYEPLAHFLTEQKHNVSVINPLVIKCFVKMNLYKAKTDKLDAIYIADYAQQASPELWVKPPKEQAQIKQLTTWIKSLIHEKNRHTNRLHALDHGADAFAFVVKDMRKNIKRLEHSIQKAQEEMQSLLETHYAQAYKLAQSIPGVGVKIASTLIAETDALKRFSSAKQLVSFVGLAARVDQSGNRQYGNKRIKKQGQGYLRSLLYMGSWTAQNCNPSCKALRERLKAKGKAPRQIKMAIASKLLRQLFGVIKSGEKFNPNGVIKA